jgi:endonuclease/exonuclease/phosphatase (EEP) superfamily protein YafD
VVGDSASFAGPRIVAGDFNSNPFYWVARMLPLPGAGSQTRGVRDFMVRHGFRDALPNGRGTYDYLGMQLDWIWVHGLRVRASGVHALDFSDHHAIWTRVEWTSGVTGAASR